MSFMSVMLSCHIVLALTATLPCLAAPQRNILQSRPVGFTGHKLLLVSFDGFRWDYDRKVQTPNLDKMARDGVKATYASPPFPTITSPSHFTLLTGRHSESHGVIHNMWFNTATREKKQYLLSQFVDSFWDNGSLPIWITAQRQGLKTGSLHFPGTAPSYRGETVGLRQVESPDFDYSNETEWRLNVDKVIGDWFFDQDLDFVSLYFGEPDVVGHAFGPDSKEVQEMIRQVDRTVGYIRDKIQEQGLTDQMNVIITSDHGMIPLLHHGDVKQIILSDIPGFSFEDIQFQLLDYGPLGMLLPKEGQLEKVYKALKGSHPNLHVYKKEKMPARLHYSNNQRILPIVLTADAGYVINGFLPLQYMKADHGFDNGLMDMKVFFRAVGPDFHKNLLVDPFHLIDVYPLMCHLLGVKPEVHDGHLDNVRHMLVSAGNTGDTNVNADVSQYLGFSAAFAISSCLVIVATSYNMCRRSKGRRKEA